MEYVSVLPELVMFQTGTNNAFLPVSSVCVAPFFVAKMQELQLMTIMDAIAACKNNVLDWLEQLLLSMFLLIEEVNKVTEEPPMALFAACQQTVSLVHSILQQEKSSLPQGIYLP